MRPYIVTLIIVAAVAFAAMAQESTPEPAPIPDKEIPFAIPSADKNLKNPVPVSEESVDHGMLLYSSQCAMCHGKFGKGDGDLARRFEMSVPDFSDSAYTKTRTDGELFYIITKGHGRMPADGERLSPEWRWNMVNAIRTLSR